jgi:hypothetical protein
MTWCHINNISFLCIFSTGTDAAGSVRRRIKKWIRLPQIDAATCGSDSVSATLIKRLQQIFTTHYKFQKNLRIKEKSLR